MKNTNKKKGNPAVTVLCVLAVIIFAAAAGILLCELISKGLVPASLMRLLVIALGGISVIGLALMISRKSAPRLVASILFLILAIGMIIGVIVLQDIDNTIAAITGDTSTISTPFDVIVRADSEISSAAALNGRSVGYGSDCSELQLASVKAKLDASAAGISYVQAGAPAEAVNGLLEGSYDALIISDNTFQILNEEIMPGIDSSTKQIESLVVTQDYSSQTAADYTEVTTETAPAATEVPVEQAPAATEAPVEQAPAATEAPVEEASAEDDPGEETVVVTPPPADAAQPENLTFNEAAESVIKSGSDSMIIYVSGNDNYGEIGLDGRSDTNIIAVVNFSTHKALLINTPRDYYLPISISDNGTRDKLTHCGIYGVQCSMDTLAAAYGIEFDHFFKVNFTGFINIIDAIGGIDVYNEFGFVDNGGNEFSMGEIHLNGTRALLWARNRHQVGIANRGKHHMMVIEAVVNKAISSPEVLLNYAQILESLEGSFLTDFSSEEIYSIVNGQLDDMRGWTFETYSVTGEGSSTTQAYSVWGSECYIVLPDYDSVAEASRLIADCVNGK